MERIMQKSSIYQIEAKNVESVLRQRNVSRVVQHPTSADKRARQLTTM